MKYDFDDVRYKLKHAPAGSEEITEETRQGLQSIGDNTSDGHLPASELQQLRSELQSRRLTRKIPWRRRFKQLFRWLT